MIVSATIPSTPNAPPNTLMQSHCFHVRHLVRTYATRPGRPRLDAALSLDHVSCALIITLASQRPPYLPTCQLTALLFSSCRDRALCPSTEPSSGPRGELATRPPAPRRGASRGTSSRDTGT